MLDPAVRLPGHMDLRLLAWTCCFASKQTWKSGCSFFFFPSSFWVRCVFSLRPFHMGGKCLHTVSGWRIKTRFHVVFCPQLFQRNLFKVDFNCLYPTEASLSMYSAYYSVEGRKGGACVLICEEMWGSMWVFEAWERGRDSKSLVQ